ncbi:hypothetical protein IFR23_16285 [Sphingomonas sp. CFBP 13603]|uniref:hypothetical protein n=1 Tax=Sphingomonas sp. CFBP 13603 TaxID=2774040 RepID=UPI001868765B|nr:hypothetical protein [Sphingomonas sp. CFBP 13603]MBE2993561.1 hypothetical protein [Sphingomonas sp. CFBP 13603]
MANRIDVAPRDHTRDRKPLIYAITGVILAAGVLMMAFYDRGGDPVPLASTQKAIVTAQR